jgi:hypothetical protein
MGVVVKFLYPPKKVEVVAILVYYLMKVEVEEEKTMYHLMKEEEVEVKVNLENLIPQFLIALKIMKVEEVVEVEVEM